MVWCCLCPQMCAFEDLVLELYQSVSDATELAADMADAAEERALAAARRAKQTARYSRVSQGRNGGRRVGGRSAAGSLSSKLRGRSPRGPSSRLLQ